jgi:hypothetical protein
MKRILNLSVVLALGLVVGSCGGSSTLDNTEASVFLTMDVTAYNPEIDICLQFTDLAIENMTITSTTKDPGGTPSANQDVNLSRWVVTPYRTDGGSAASPEWTYDQHVFVPAGGSADLENYRIYPLEFLREVPIAYLLPENGGFEPATGFTNIRESLQLTIYGKTVSGKNVATTPIPIAFNFYCNGQ